MYRKKEKIPVFSWDYGRSVKPNGFVVVVVVCCANRFPNILNMLLNGACVLLTATGFCNDGSVGGSSTMFEFGKSTMFPYAPTSCGGSGGGSVFMPKKPLKTLPILPKKPLSPKNKTKGSIFIYPLQALARLPLPISL